MKKILQAIGKKNIIIVSGILLIGAAIAVNLSLGAPNSVDAGTDYYLENITDPTGDKVLGQATLVDSQAAVQNYFATSQLNRQRARDEAIEVLRNVAESEDSIQEMKNSALSDISAIALEIEKEANIETLIKAKGFTDCVAIVSGDIANVIVKSIGLMPNEVAQIKEIVYEQANILPQNTKIIEKSE